MRDDGTKIAYMCTTRSKLRDRGCIFNYMTPRWPKMAENSPKMRQKESKMPPRWAEMALKSEKRGKDAPKMGQNCIKMVQNGVKNQSKEHQRRKAEKKNANWRMHGGFWMLFGPEMGANIGPKTTFLDDKK